MAPVFVHFYSSMDNNAIVSLCNVSWPRSCCPRTTSANESTTIDPSDICIGTTVSFLRPSYSSAVDGDVQLAYKFLWRWSAAKFFFPISLHLIAVGFFPQIGLPKHDALPYLSVDAFAYSCHIFNSVFLLPFSTVGQTVTPPSALPLMTFHSSCVFDR